MHPVLPGQQHEGKLKRRKEPGGGRRPLNKPRGRKVASVDSNKNMKHVVQETNVGGRSTEGSWENG